MKLYLEAIVNVFDSISEFEKEVIDNVIEKRADTKRHLLL